MNEQVWLGVISAVSGIAITYITVKGKTWVARKQEKPKDRMETIFDGYEKLIKQQEMENTRKEETISRLEGIVQRQEDELRETKRLLDIVRAELEQSKQQNKLLIQHLESLKAEYGDKSLPMSAPL